MKQFSLLLILALAILGCGKKGEPSEPEAKAQPKAETKQPKAKASEPEKAVEKPSPAGAFTNTLGMVFKPVPGTKVQFCIWETRVKDYAAYAAANAGVDGFWKKPFREFKQTDTHPVVHVSWEDANAFCAWLTRKERAAGKITANQSYRLPTDAEWSVAVGLGRESGNTPEAKDGGVKGVYPWGKAWPPPKGAGNYDKSLKVDKFDYTAPVGSFAANAQGLHDLAGNVWEWCEDKWNPTSSHRVLRGASWGDYGPGYVLSSGRGRSAPGRRSDGIGFRCVLADGSGG